MKAASFRKTMMPAATLALFVGLAAAAATGPEADRILIGQADGSWRIIEAIHEEPPPLAAVTLGLLIDEPDRGEVDATASDVATAQEEAAIRRAFEEAVDAARREPRR